MKVQIHLAQIIGAVISFLQPDEPMGSTRFMLWRLVEAMRAVPQRDEIAFEIMIDDEQIDDPSRDERKKWESDVEAIGASHYDHIRALVDPRVDDFMLSDDGSLDTVIEHEPTGETIRYSQEYAAEYRDEDGSLDLDAMMRDEIEHGIEIDLLDEAIQEMPLSVLVRSGFYPPCNHESDRDPVEYEILLSTGGPACRLRGSLDEYMMPEDCRIEVSGWFQPWTRCYFVEIEDDAETVERNLLSFARSFYFGERS